MHLPRRLSFDHIYATTILRLIMTNLHERARRDQPCRMFLDRDSLLCFFAGRHRIMQFIETILVHLHESELFVFADGFLASLQHLVLVHLDQRGEEEISCVVGGEDIFSVWYVEHAQEEVRCCSKVGYENDAS